jgi:hypothetical protein
MAPLARLLIPEDESLVAWDMGFHRPFRVRGPLRSGLTLRRSTWPSKASPHEADIYMRAIDRSESTLKSATIIGLAGSLRVIQAYVRARDMPPPPPSGNPSYTTGVDRWESSAIRVRS